MKSPEELRTKVIQAKNDQINEALSHIVPTLLIVEEYIEKACSIGRSYTYMHAEHRKGLAKSTAMNITYDYLEKKGYRVDRKKNIIFWSE